jgi:two-component system, LuxR family, response regulator FixJ
MMYEPEQCVVHVVDDDASLRRSLRFLLESVDWRVQLHASAEEFLAVVAPSDHPTCVLLDVRMPSMSGLELQQLLRARGIAIPIVFMTGHADVSMAVQAMKFGAVDFIEKPFKDQAVLDAVALGIRRSAEALEADRLRHEASAGLAALSPREREVAILVAQGHPNKLVADRLGISEKTVHIHRHRVMEKAGVSSAAELARLMLRADPRALDEPPAAT